MDTFIQTHATQNKSWIFLSLKETQNDVEPHFAATGNDRGHKMTTNDKTTCRFVIILCLFVVGLCLLLVILFSLWSFNVSVVICGRLVVGCVSMWSFSLFVDDLRLFVVNFASF